MMRRFPLWSCSLAVLACLAALPAAAVSINSADLERLLACRGIAAEGARVRCFDRASAVIARAAASSAPAAASADTTVTASPSPGSPASRALPNASALDPKQTFGLSAAAIVSREMAAQIKPERISSITARIAAFHLGPDGRTIYRLDDGQIWEELLNDGDRPPVRQGDLVRISRGWLSSYWLQTTSGRGCKVERLR
jgi:hypothetical protein